MDKPLKLCLVTYHSGAAGEKRMKLATPVLKSIRLSSDTVPDSLRRAISCSTRAISSRTDAVLTVPMHSQIAQRLHSASKIRCRAKNRAQRGCEQLHRQDEGIVKRINQYRVFGRDTSPPSTPRVIVVRGAISTNSTGLSKRSME